jgi:hypothetical protein
MKIVMVISVILMKLTTKFISSVITERIDNGTKIIKKNNKYYVDNIVGKIIHYYILIEISCHYIFSIGNFIDNFKCIITDNKPSPLSSSSISQQKQQPLPLFCHKSRPYTHKSSHLNTQ